jgi:hypothetical protein
MVPKGERWVLMMVVEVDLASAHAAVELLRY